LSISALIHPNIVRFSWINAYVLFLQQLGLHFGYFDFIAPPARKLSFAGGAVFPRRRKASNKDNSLQAAP
jgi:hypothetical protein